MNHSTNYGKSSRTKSPLNHYIDNFLSDNFQQVAGNDFLQNQPSVNMLETAHGFRLELAAPGYTKEAFELRVEENYLLVAAAGVIEKSKNGAERWLRREFSFKGFNRRFLLPKSVNFEAITAVYDLGLLVVDLPTKEQSATSQKVISVK